MRKKQKFPLILRLVLFATLIVIIYVQKKENAQLNMKLNNISVLTWDNETMKMLKGFEIDEKQMLLTPTVLNSLLKVKSPFNDGLSFEKLNKKYIRNRRTDRYGAPRRTGQFRRKHDGVDWFVPENTKLYPLAPIGIVTKVSDQEHGMYEVDAIDAKGKKRRVPIEYGKYVKILYPDGTESLYAHLNEVFVKPNQLVLGDTCIGVSGYTGNIRNSGKPSHLHLELRLEDDSTFDPMHRFSFNDYNLPRFFDKIIIEQKTDNEKAE